MCDTVCIPPRSDGGSWFFAKNSDRHPDEPQVMCLAHGPDGACLVSRPVWMRGAEMGINAHGVAIGNEAVFARRAPPRDGTLGMEILRQALERAATAEDALAFITDFVETRGQGGNGAYRGTLVYDNSYIVAGRDGAWVVETAGRRWAARRAAGPAAISNTYSLTDDFERADAATLARRAPGYSWKASQESPLHRLVTKGDRRRACSLGMLPSDGAVSVEALFAAMRTHGPYDIDRPNRRNMEAVCMHEGGLVNNATTASLAAAAGPDGGCVIWYTASPSPCLSLYKPAVLERGSFTILWTDYDHREGSQSAAAYWTARRASTRAMRRAAFHDPGFVARRDAAQRELVALVEGRRGPADDGRVSAEVNRVVRAFESA
jgi:secernin